MNQLEPTTVKRTDGILFSWPIRTKCFPVCFISGMFWTSGLPAIQNARFT